MTSLFQKLTKSSKDYPNTNGELGDTSRRNSNEKKASSEANRQAVAAAVAADLADLYLSSEDSFDKTDNNNNSNNTKHANDHQKQQQQQQNQLMDSNKELSSDDLMLMMTMPMNSLLTKVSHSSSSNSNTSGYVTNSNSNSSESQQQQQQQPQPQSQQHQQTVTKRSKLESMDSIMDDLMTLNTPHSQNVPADELNDELNYFEQSDPTNNGKSLQMSKYLTTPLSAATITPVISNGGMHVTCNTASNLGDTSGSASSAMFNCNNETANSNSGTIRSVMFNNLNEINQTNKQQQQQQQHMSSSLILGKKIVLNLKRVNKNWT